MKENSERQTWVVDFDDYSPVRPGHDLLIKLKEHFPDFKCTCFTPAFNLAVFMGKMSVKKFEDWGRLVEENRDWIEIAPHGFSHLRGEMLCDEKQARVIIAAMENVFKKIGLNFVKVFKAPHWEISEQAEKVLAEKGYTLAIDRNRPIVRADMPTYIYNWSIHEMPIPDYPIIKAHGHIWDTAGTQNGLDRCLPNLLKMPTNAKFKFVSEYLNGQGISTKKN